MTQMRVSEAAELLAVSPDTIRRWIDGGRLTATKGAGPVLVDGADLARLAHELGLEPGVVAVASIKSTNVVIATPGSPA